MRSNPLRVRLALTVRQPPMRKRCQRVALMISAGVKLERAVELRRAISGARAGGDFEMHVRLLGLRIVLDARLNMVLVETVFGQDAIEAGDGGLQVVLAKKAGRDSRPAAPTSWPALGGSDTVPLAETRPTNQLFSVMKRRITPSPESSASTETSRYWPVAKRRSSDARTSARLRIAPF